MGPTNTTLVSGMNTQDHTTRTLLIPQKASNMLVVSRGSTSNIDLEAEQLSSGHSQVRAFNLTSITLKPHNYDTDGVRLGWGLRNSVGVGEHPLTGGIYTVENSADEVTRQGLNIHEDNPGEEMNFLGYLNGTHYTDQGRNFGCMCYIFLSHGFLFGMLIGGVDPLCFAAWDVNAIPDNGNLTVGSQFVIGTPNNTVNDGYCERDTVAPRLTFQAHMVSRPRASFSGWEEAYRCVAEYHYPGVIERVYLGVLERPYLISLRGLCSCRRNSIFLSSRASTVVAVGH